VAGAGAVFCDGIPVANSGGCRAGTGRTQTGGAAAKVNLDETALLAGTPDRSILALDEALTDFSQVAPRQARVVELRYFGGLTEEEISAVLKTSPRTVRRDWDLARAWLLRELSHGEKKSPNDPRAFPAN
jgi:RNA polymerase sigma factor (TIGR02999 family)